ncbi:hypothetical protein PybrP1_011023, partial [[Pythium] brassicae (nom. inval.)]
MQSVDAQDDDAHDLAHLLSDDDGDAGGRSRVALFTESVMALLSRMAPSTGDEIAVEDLKVELMQLPHDSNALSLVHLLNEVREEYVPREAVCQIWRKLNASSASQCVPLGSSSKLKAAKRARSAASIPIVRSRLLESKRKQAECDLKLLQNRILLLQQEESKAWKKIVQTKDRAQEILQIREANMKRQEEKSLQAMAREQATRSVQKRQHVLKKESVVKKKHAAIQVISKKYQDVELVKSESRRLKAERERLQLEEVERAKEKRESVRRQEDALKRQKQSERVAQDHGVALRLMKKVIDDERAIREHKQR